MNKKNHFGGNPNVQGPWFPWGPWGLQWLQMTPLTITFYPQTPILGPYILVEGSFYFHQYQQEITAYEVKNLDLLS